MAIFGRRTPHGPIILGQPVYGGAAPSPPIGKTVQVAVAQQVSRYHLPLRALILVPTVIGAAAGPPVGAAVVVSKNAIRAAVLRNHPKLQPIILTAGGPAVAAAPVGKHVIVSRNAQYATVPRYHPAFKPIILKAGGQPSAASIVNVGLRSRGAVARYHPIFKPIILSQPLLAAPPAPVGKILLTSARQPGQYRPLFLPIIKRAGGQPSVAKIVKPRGEKTSGDAARIAYHPLVKILITQPITTLPPKPIGQIVVKQAARDIAHRPVKVITLSIPLPAPSKPVAKIVLTAAATPRSRANPVFQPIIKRAGGQPSLAKIVRILSPQSIRYRPALKAFVATFTPPPPVPKMGQAILVMWRPIPARRSMVLISAGIVPSVIPPAPPVVATQGFTEAARGVTFVEGPHG